MADEQNEKGHLSNASQQSTPQDDIFVHHKPSSFSDKVALKFVKFLRFFADAFFAQRYGNRAVVLETVAAVPGMVGGAMLHLRSLRKMRNDEGWIRTLLDEAENERMHLMTFVEIAKPTFLERIIVISAQFLFYVLYLIIYVLSTKTAHRIVGYLEEEAVVSYSDYLNLIEEGQIENVDAPQIAIDYWKLNDNAKLKDVITVIRADEMSHREVNHLIADKLSNEETSVLTNKDMSAAAQQNLERYQEREFPK